VKNLQTEHLFAKICANAAEFSLRMRTALSSLCVSLSQPGFKFQPGSTYNAQKSKNFI
jgi:hypothetical protein